MTSGVSYTTEEMEAVKKKVLEYLLKTAGGTFAAACKYANVPFSTAYDMRKADPKWNEDVIAARNAADDLGGDFAESKLMEAINNNELTGIIFYLKTKHKHRGYIERQNLDVDLTTKGESINLNAQDLEILKNAGIKQD